MSIETDRNQIQVLLDEARSFWGTGQSTNPQIDLWNPTSLITKEMVMKEGAAHGCRVIETVLGRPDSLEEKFRSYGLKNRAYIAIGTLIEKLRPDLLKDWQKGEYRKQEEKTHRDLRRNIQVPKNVDKQRIEPVVRMPIYYICNTIRTLELVAHGKKPELTKQPYQDSYYTVDLKNDFSRCIGDAQDLDDLCVRFATQTALILHQRGIANKDIAGILVSCFASTGLIREYGQQRHAEKIVDDIMQSITAAGSLPGLTQEFRNQARTNVRRIYFGKTNSQI